MKILLDRLRAALVEADKIALASTYVAAITTVIEQVERYCYELADCLQIGSNLHDHVNQKWCVLTFQINNTVTSQVRDIKTGTVVATYDNFKATALQAHEFSCQRFKGL